VPILAQEFSKANPENLRFWYSGGILRFQKTRRRLVA
jgi:hypothetical protein